MMLLVFFCVTLIPTSFAQSSSSSESSDCDDSDNRGHNHDHHNHRGDGNHACPGGWQRFERDRGSWCIGTFYNDQSGGYSWDAAQRLCQEHEAVLTGVESSSEQNFIMTNMISKWQTSLGAIWLGGKRKQVCTKPSWNAQICNNPLTSFYWTDGFTSGTAGYNWLTGQPDALPDSYGVVEGCIQMWMNSKQDKWRGFFDDQFCYFTYAANVNIGNYGYACGKQPSR